MVRHQKQIRPGYKLTEVGIIPEDWKIKKLKDCLINNPEYGINAAAVDYSHHLPTYIRITDISDDGKFLPEKKTSVNHIGSEAYFLEDGDIVFARTGASTGKTYLYNKNDGRLVFAGFLIRIRVDQKILNPKYLKACTETSNYWKWVTVMSMRSGQPGINGNEYASLALAIPSESEQSAIAQVLSDTDNLIASLDTLIEKKRSIKQGAMQELLTGRRRLPGFNGEWENEEVRNILHIQKGEQLNRSELFVKGDYPAWNGGVEPSGYTDLWNMEADTITISEGGNSCGFIGHVKTKFWLGGHCYALLNLSQKINKLFLYQLLKLNEKNIMALRIGSGLPNIQKKNLGEFLIGIPVDITEQSAIAQILSDMDTEIQILEAKRDKYKSIKQGMMSELLTGNIRLLGA